MALAFEVLRRQLGETGVSVSCLGLGGSHIDAATAALADGYRQRMFLMTKFDARTKVARLNTDHVDLLQVHEVIRFAGSDRFFAQGGAAESAISAKKAGKVRFLGFTGYKDPRVHLYTLGVARRTGFRFDAVRMPLNPFGAPFRSFEQLVLPELLSQRIAVPGMKSRTEDCS